MATEIGSSVAGSIAGKVTDSLVDAAGRQLGYLLHYDDNIEALIMRAKELAAKRESIQAKIDAAQRNSEIILADVQNWIAQADSISAAAEKFLEDEVKENKRCFRGWCINLSSRLQSSKEAKKQTTAILDQLQKAGNFENVSSPAPPAGIISSFRVFSGTFQTRKSIMSQIMQALDDANVRIIGICGMGGVGKTTLVKEIGKKAKELKLYDAVVMAVVSQNPSILKIQGEIAHMLGFSGIPENAGLARANSLWERMKKEKRILVILDDVWKRIELEEIGIPFGNDHQGCKIVLTSRSKSVCDQMECEKIFTVETLSKQESWVLFKELSGLVAENDEISPIARDIAAKCGGLPIAIVTIARALKNKNQHVWRDAARQLSQSFPANIEGIQGSVISSLELSYNYLESGEAKSLFLFCSLFPEDFKIPVEVLMRYGVGLRWFENVERMEDIRERVHAVVSTLTNSFLLIDDCNDDDVECVKMHDVVRDFALIIAPKYNHMYMVRAGVGLKEWPSRETFEDLTAISLMSNDIKEVHDGLDCPKLQTFLLQGNNELVVPNNFFQDLSENNVLAMPESLSLLSNLRTLYLNYCKLGDLSLIGKLSNLEILSLSCSDFEDIPISFSQLTSLRLLDLNYCRTLKLISHGVIHCLRKLEELYVNRFVHWDYEREDVGINARLSELQVLSRLTRLHICIPNLDIFPHDLSFQNLISFTLKIGPDYISGAESRYGRNITLSLMSTSKIPSWVKTLLKRTECLILNQITGSDQNILDDLVQGGFNNLKSLTIDSSEIKYLLNTLEWTPNLSFHYLEELTIGCNPNLVEICHGQPPAQTFNKLKSLWMNATTC